MPLHPRALPAGFIAPCLPTKAPTPSGDVWLHEIKHDGFRVIARKDPNRVKLYSRPGNDLTDRFPLIDCAVALDATLEDAAGMSIPDGGGDATVGQPAPRSNYISTSRVGG
jgi:ATP-dependent DNA ligase